MGGAFRLLSVKGIDIKMHITFPLILIWAAIQFGFLARQGIQGAVFGVIVTTLLFVVVVLHELGHSFAALRYNVDVEEIVILPIGGVARLARIPLGFMGDGRDTANAALFLASDEARFITGTEIVVDGGMTARCD